MTVQERLERARRYLAHDLWDVPPDPGSRLSAGVRLLQFSMMLGEGFVRDRLLLRASALTYFTVLSIVPMVAVAVAIASAVGVGSRTFVDWVVGTIAAGVPEAAEPIRALIAGVDFTSLGAVGGSVLLLTTVLALSNVERTFNDIWGVSNGRSWVRRFTDYLAVLLVAPALGGLALSLTTWLRGRWVVSQLAEMPGLGVFESIGAALVPVVMLSAAFVFLYAFLPNTHVRMVSAALGGVVAGVMVAMAQALYVEFSIGVARADAFFGGFALLPLLFAWIYVFWAIVLLGAQIAFAHQNFALYRQEVRGDPANPAEREAIALRLALEVARHFRQGEAVPDVGDLAEDLEVPVRTLRAVAAKLVDAGILAQRSGAAGQDALQLGRPAETVAVTDVLAALHGERSPLAGDPAPASLVSELLGELDAAAHAVAGERTLADLLQRLEDAPADAAQGPEGDTDAPRGQTGGPLA